MTGLQCFLIGMVALGLISFAWDKADERDIHGGVLLFACVAFFGFLLSLIVGAMNRGAI